jgi:peptidoglycan-associated lipoprotein
MYKLRSSKFVHGVLAAAFAVMLACPLTASAEDDDGANGETPAELLIDGTDALHDHADDSARRLFEKLIALFPASSEAARARIALTALDNGDDDDERAAIRADEAERTLEYRHAFLINAGDRVFFAENSSKIGGRARSIIEAQARWLKARPGLTVTVIGRSDDGGDRRAAEMLSRERAEVVRERLIAAGLDPSRIQIRPVGNDDRVALCSSPLCQAQNRNAEVFINDLRDQEQRRLSAEKRHTGGAKTSMAPAAESSLSDQIPQ